VVYTEKLLTGGFDLKTSERYAWKRKKAPWATDQAQWDDLWRRRIQNEYVGRLVARQMAKENPEPATASTTTNAPAAPKDAEHADPTPAADVPAETLAELQLTPEQAILKSYRRFLTILEDNDAAFVLDRYFNAFTQSYDPHSDYLSPDNTEDFDIGMRLSLFGIGALLTSEDGAAKVERLIPGGPAAKDGRLQVGDKIVAVGQGDQPAEDILHLPLQKAVRKIRGEKGSKVVLSVVPVNDATGTAIKKVDLVRDEVKLEEQAAKGEVQEITDPQGVKRKLGVIRLPEFYADMKSNRADARSSTRDVVKILADQQKQGVQGIILDLRSNGGGSLAEAINLTGAFIESGPVVQVKDQRRLQILSDPDPATVYTGPLIVLVNRLSASASEILAAALQDYGRALIVGDSKTHGKGTVQTLSTLAEGLRLLRQPTNDLGSVKLTTASFYRIAGGSTQLNGVKPDIIISSPMDQMEVGEEFLPHALAWTEVYQAFYDPVRDLAPVVPALREASAKRRLKDSTFSAPYFPTIACPPSRRTGGSRRGNPGVAHERVEEVVEVPHAGPSCSPSWMAPASASTARAISSPPPSSPLGLAEAARALHPLKAHGTAVGMPSDEDMGNSEVGHNAIGAGRVFSQGASLVENAINSGALFEGATWKELIANVVQHGTQLHFIGLLSDGNVHSHIRHLFAMLQRAKRRRGEAARAARAAGRPRCGAHLRPDLRGPGWRPCSRS
jgi:C-terminal peptidase prc